MRIILKNKNLKNDAQFKYPEKHINKIMIQTKINIKCKTYINCINFNHI